MFIQENKAGQAKWSNIIKEELGVKNADKLAWVSQYAANHEIKESAASGIQNGQILTGTQSPVFATPMNTIGMGNPAAPSALPVDTTSQAGFFGQTPGSGDVPMSTLPMALNIALTTIGLELLSVIPSNGPWGMLSYMDFPYAGGKLGLANETSFDGIGDGTQNKPIYVKVLGADSVIDTIKAAIVTASTTANPAVIATVADAAGNTLKGKLKGFSRVDGGILLETVSCMKSTDNVSISSVFKTPTTGVTVKLFAANGTTAVGTSDGYNLYVAGEQLPKPDFVQTQADLVDGFANFATGDKEAMTRAQNETGTGNTIGLRLFSKWIQMGSYEVTGTLTRQQLQDLPLYGVDAVGKVMEACQNEISQHINQRILEQVFALGVTNAVNQRRFQGVDLNLHMGQTDKAMANMSIANYKDIHDVDHKATWGTIKNTEINSSAENLYTRQRRIASRCFAASNLIQTVGRRGKADWIVANAQVVTALQDCSTYIINPMTNDLKQDGSNLYLAGSLGGMQVYCDPYMRYDDTRICVGRKGDGNSPGLIFMPYILADTISITAPGTMAPKMLVNSRFALTAAGFYPEQQYYTFVVDCDYGLV